MAFIYDSESQICTYIQRVCVTSRQTDRERATQCLSDTLMCVPEPLYHPKIGQNIQINSQRPCILNASVLNGISHLFLTQCVCACVDVDVCGSKIVGNNHVISIQKWVIHFSTYTCVDIINDGNSMSCIEAALMCAYVYVSV